MLIPALLKEIADFNFSTKYGTDDTNIGLWLIPVRFKAIADFNFSMKYGTDDIE